MPGRRLAQATRAQAREAHERWRPTWGAGLSSADLDAQEAALSSHSFGVAHRRVLVLLEGASFSSSCEVLTIPVGDSFLWHIACVWTPLEQRKRGAASALIQAVIESARSLDAAAIVLWSDIDPSFYERLGFSIVTTDLNDVSLPALRSTAVQPELLVDIATDADLTFVVTEDECSPLDSDCPKLTPSRLDWAVAPERIKVARGLQTPLIARGARLAGGVVVWCVDVNELAILLLRAPTLAVAQALLMRARDVAAVAGLACVRLWEGARTLAGDSINEWVAAQGGVEPRKGRIPMSLGLKKKLNLCGMDRALWY